MRTPRLRFLILVAAMLGVPASAPAQVQAISDFDDEPACAAGTTCPNKGCINNIEGAGLDGWFFLPEEVFAFWATNGSATGVCSSEVDGYLRYIDPSNSNGGLVYCDVTDPAIDPQPSDPQDPLCQGELLGDWKDLAGEGAGGALCFDFKVFQNDTGRRCRGFCADDPSIACGADTGPCPTFPGGACVGLTQCDPFSVGTCALDPTITCRSDIDCNGCANIGCPRPLTVTIERGQPFDPTLPTDPPGFISATFEAGLDETVAPARYVSGCPTGSGTCCDPVQPNASCTPYQDLDATSSPWRTVRVPLDRLEWGRTFFDDTRPIPSLPCGAKRRGDPDALAEPRYQEIPPDEWDRLLDQVDRLEIRMEIFSNSAINDERTAIDNVRIGCLLDAECNSPTSSVSGIIEAVQVLPAASFKNGENGRKTLINKLEAALDKLGECDCGGAVNKLVNDILARLDGCACPGAAGVTSTENDDLIALCTDQCTIRTMVEALIDDLREMCP